MKQILNCLAAIATSALIGSSLVSFGEKGVSIGSVFEKTWESEIIEHKGFKDLGNYVIELLDYTVPSIEKVGLTLINERLDHGVMPAPAECTSKAKLNGKGEVVIGRNIYVYRTTYGKYKNFCVTYSPGGFKQQYQLAEASTYDPKIKEYYDVALKTGRLVIDKGILLSAI